MDRIRQLVRRWALPVIAAAILYAGSMILIEVVRGPTTAVGIRFFNFIAERSCPNCGTVMPLDIYPKFIVIPLSAFGRGFARSRATDRRVGESDAQGAQHKRAQEGHCGERVTRER
jgi:hypothetical protein